MFLHVLWVSAWFGLAILRKLCVYETSSLAGVCLSLNNVSESKHVSAMSSTGHGKVSFVQ